MDTITARPGLLKQANLSSIRKVIKARTTATRAEIAHETRISPTTVRSLLSEMLQNGELESEGFDQSSGGRKAQRYRLKADRYFGAAFCLADSRVHCLIVNLFGEIVEHSVEEVCDGNVEASIDSFLGAQIKQREIRSIGVGVPGIVNKPGTGYMQKDPLTGRFCKVNLGDALARKYSLPVILENDINATAIGFGRCYESEFPDENPQDTNMAYLHFEECCITAGFLSGGRILRGCNNFAGELSLVPMEDGRSLDQWMAEPMDDAEYTRLVIKVIGWVLAVLNPQYVALGGPGLRRDCVGPIGDGLLALVPDPMFAEILCSFDPWQDYCLGMAYLTAEKIFDGVQFIRG